MIQSIKTLILFIALFFILSSCEKAGPTTYQVINNAESFNIIGIEPEFGTLYNAEMLYLIGENVAETYNLGTIEADGGTSEVIEVPEDIEKIKLSFKQLGPDSPYYFDPGNIRYFVVAYKFLDKGVLNEVVFENRTFISNKVLLKSMEADSDSLCLESFKPGASAGQNNLFETED